MILPQILDLAITGTQYDRLFYGATMKSDKYLKRGFWMMNPNRDQYDPRPAKLKYLIVSQPRTGSTLLGMLLEANGIGIPQEYLSGQNISAYCALHKITDFEKDAYLDHLFDNRKSPDGTFGMKVHIEQLPGFLSNDDSRDLDERIGEFIGRFDVVVFINRRNKLAQATSHWLGLRSGDWVSIEKKRKSDMFVTLTEQNFVEILKLFPRYITQDLQMRNLYRLTKADKLQLWYEDMLADKEDTVKKLAALFDMPDLKWRETTKVMRNNVNEDLEFQILNRLLGDIDADKIFPLLDR